MNFRNISSWCIRNPVFPIVLFVGLMLAGLIAFARMQVNNAPDIDFPGAIVSVSQPGAAPNEMETQVTQRVESAIRGVTGVEETARSTTSATSYPRSAATCPKASSSRGSPASTPKTSPSPTSAPKRPT